MENKAVGLSPTQLSLSAPAPSSAGGGGVSARTKVNVSDSSSAPPAQLSQAYVSPKGVVDPKSGVFVLQVRDSETGEVKDQYPSQKAVSAYSRASAVSTSPTVSSSEGQVPSVATGNESAGGVGAEGVSADIGKSDTVA